jgi:hypothetical protein
MPKERRMRTRADYYIGTGKNAEWLGSTSYDGDEIDRMLDDGRGRDDTDCWAIKLATSEQAFREAVATMLAHRDDATTPDQGWPWPWKDSTTTDFAYAFVDGRCKSFSGLGEKMGEWPDMISRRNVTLGPRSGVMLLRK